MACAELPPVSTAELASYVYVYTWVPILPNVPWFPFAIIATNNKFQASWVFAQWRIIHEACAELGLRLAGHVSDGDSRLRMPMWTGMSRNEDACPAFERTWAPSKTIHIAALEHCSSDFSFSNQ